MVSTQPKRARLRVALIFGGRSGEHDVSVVSARSVMKALDRGRYEVLPMAIDHNGGWADPDTSRAVIERSGDRADEVYRFLGSRPVDPRLLAGEVDVAFPVLHGPFGEDGTVQGLLEMLGLPYVGCDVTSSAVCMDKGLTKRLLVQSSLPTVDWVEVSRCQWTHSAASVRRSCLDLGLPVFVKPARLGSSVGISKVRSEEQLDQAIDTALGYGERTIVERGVRAREIEVAVLGGDSPRASAPGEIVPGHEFYDYADKYLDSACQLLAPAPISPALAGKAQELAVACFKALLCHGMARVDMFVANEAHMIWVNEVNTIPGFTPISMYPRLWELSGLPYSGLLDELLGLAMERRGQGC